ncbi:MAG: T9SS type A sorting domain-containing protein [Bacteroidota bacterium]
MYRFLGVIGFFLTAFLSDAQQVFFSSTINLTSGSVSANKVLQCYNGDYVIAGNSGTNFFFSRIDYYGTPLIVRTYDLNYSGSIIQTSDSGFLITGAVMVQTPGPLAPVPAVVKLDAWGNLIFCKLYNNYPGAAGGIVPGNNGNFLIGGWNLGSMVMEIDNNGNLVHGRQYLYDQAYLAAEDIVSDSANNKYVIMKTQNGLAVLKYNLPGSVTWSYTLAGSYSHLRLKLYGNSLYIGYSDANGFNLIKQDTSGNTILSRKIVANDSLLQTDMVVYLGKIIVCGRIPAKNCPFLMELDTGFSVLRTRIYYDGQQPLSAQFKALAIGSEGSILVSGLTGTDAYFARFDSVFYNQCLTDSSYIVSDINNSVSPLDTIPDILAFSNNVTTNIAINYPAYAGSGCQFVNIEDVYNENQCRMFPIPFSDYATLDINPFYFPEGEAELILYNSIGKEIRRIYIHSPRTTISREDLSSGIYLYQIVISSRIIGSGRLVIE